MPPPVIRFACCCNLVKSSLNLRWKSIRSLAYTTCSDVSDRSPDTNVLCHPIEKPGKFEVINTLDQRKREGTSAMLFCRQLKEFGFKHDVETYMAIVRLLCDSGMDVRLNNLFMHVIENNIAGIEISHLLEALIEEKLVKGVEVLVKLYASVGRFKEAMRTVSEMKSRVGLMVSTRTCNFIISEFIEWGNLGMVELVFRELKRNGLIPNVYTYGILMKGYCRKEGGWMKAPHLFPQMELDGVKPNAYITGTFIHAISWNPDSALQAVLAFRRVNKPVDVFAYACVIRGLVKESRLQDAEKLFVGMKLGGEVVPDANCYGALIRGYLEKGETGKALDLSKEMESTTGIKADYVAARSMMKRLCGLGRLDKALSEFTGFMESEGFVDGASFNMAIDASCKLGRMGDAMWLVKVMKRKKMKIGKMHYRTLMNGYCLQGEPWKALDMFQEMMRNGLTPDSTDYHVLARGGVFLPLNILFK